MSLNIIKEKDLKLINNVLSKLREEAEVICVLLVDKGGHVFSYQGFTDSFDIVSLAALAAGSFASTKEIAKLVGEPEFTVMFHQGKKEHIHIGLVADKALLVIIFDDRTTVGMVRVYANQYSKELAEILIAMEKNNKSEYKKYDKNREINAADSAEISDKLDLILPDE